MGPLVQLSADPEPVKVRRLSAETQPLTPYRPVGIVSHKHSTDKRG
jgi:hypothetical protein